MSDISFPFILMIHYVADFRMQSRHIAETKSKCNKSLSIHVLLYVATFLIAGLVHFVTGNNVDVWKFSKYVIINGLLHWLTDYITSRESTKAYQNGDMEKFWNIIGLDQLIHGVTLYMTWEILK
jgi:hypothetical protein